MSLPIRIHPKAGRHLALASATLLLAAADIGAQSKTTPALPITTSTKAADRIIEKACQSAEVEATLKKREYALLGGAHAEQHARMRVHQCEVERGVRKVPAKDIIKSGPDTLREDNDIRKVILNGGIAPNKVGFVSVALITTPPIEASIGRWSAPFIVPITGVTAVMLNTGNVMFWSYDPVDYHNPANSNNGVAYIWNPTTRTGHNIPPPENLFCAGQTILADGRVYVAGGNLRYPDPNLPAGQNGWRGSLTSYTFNPYTELWARQPNMQRGRWYPTLTQIADNQVVITSGTDESGSNAINNVVEVLIPDPNIDGIGKITAVAINDSSGTYPLQFLMPSGKVLQAGPNAASSSQLDPRTWNWTNLPKLTSNHYDIPNGVSFTDASVVPNKQLIMVAGGSSNDIPLANNEWLDAMNPLAGWRTYPQWLQKRHNSNTVILPDGTLLTMGGNSGSYGYENALLEAELYSKQATDTTGTWQTVAPHSIQAAYHSSALLLPDATVLLSQDDMDNTAAAQFQHKAQVYSPPYLFKGAQPQIVSAPINLTYGQSFIIGTDRDGMAGATLVAPAATTHGNDMHQRAIKLAVQPRLNGLTASVPASSALVPPGYYMLFVMDKAGIPSVSKFVHVS